MKKIESEKDNPVIKKLQNEIILLNNIQSYLQHHSLELLSKIEPHDWFNNLKILSESLIRVGYGKNDIQSVINEAKYGSSIDDQFLDILKDIPYYYINDNLTEKEKDAYRHLISFSESWNNLDYTGHPASYHITLKETDKDVFAFKYEIFYFEEERQLFQFVNFPDSKILKFNFSFELIFYYLNNKIFEDGLKSDEIGDLIEGMTKEEFILDLIKFFISQLLEDKKIKTMVN